MEENNISDEDKELMMALSPAYLYQREEWRQEGLQKGLEIGLQQGLKTGFQEGIKEGERSMVVGFLIAHFGSLDTRLSAIVTPMMELSLTERTQLLLNLSNLSREELLARFKVD